jgi:hypothetical protein
LPRQDENSVRAKLELAKEAKLEATKRKLQEGYQEFNNGTPISLQDQAFLAVID